MVSLAIVAILFGSASARFGGTQCTNGGGGDECTTTDGVTDCRITGSTRRRLGRVGAKFCLNGTYTSAWYDTTEKQCNADKKGFKASLDANFGWSYNPAALSGQCYQENGFSYIRTCVGQPDYAGYLIKRYTGSTCSGAPESTLNSSSSESACFCNSDDRYSQPTSDCVTCDKSETQCSTQELCTKAESGKCGWSSSTCGCKSNNYKLSGVCIGGTFNDLYFKTSTYAACKSVSGYYLKSPTDSRRRQATKCKTTGLWGNAKSMVDVSCTGVPDGQPPFRKMYSDTNCQTEITSARSRAFTEVQENCTCMPLEDKITSECSSCSPDDSKCGSKMTCTLSKEGTCAYTNNKCMCSSNIYRTEGYCWGGKLSTLYFKNVELAKCQSFDAASLTFAREKTDDSDLQCRPDTSHVHGLVEGVTVSHSIRKDCTGVADGGVPNISYFSDASCSTKVHSKQGEEEVENKCRCELYLGCTKGNKFEKYLCDAAGGKIIAHEYSDAACKTKTGATRTMDSFTDGAAGTCLPWPPPSLKPNYDISLKWGCSGKDKAPNLTYWRSQQCDGKPGTTTVTNCYCKDELKFAEIAKADNAQVEGSLSLDVGDAETALQDDKFKNAVKETIAETAGVNPANVVDLKLTGSRRLELVMSHESPGRRLASGKVTASYKLIVPKSMAVSATTSLKDVTTKTLTTKIASKAETAGLSYTVTVAEKSAPTEKEATFTPSSGIVAEEKRKKEDKGNKGAVNNANGLSGTVAQEKGKKEDKGNKGSVNNANGLSGGSLMLVAACVFLVLWSPRP